MTDQDVRDMLRERASSITPAPDGFERIEAKLEGAPAAVVAERRRRPLRVLAAAAVLVVVAVLGAVLAARDDATEVESGPLATTPTTEVPSATTSDPPLGVWPWPGDQVDESVLDDPIDTARAYVASIMLDATYDMTHGELQQGDANSGEIVFTGDVITTVAVRQVDGRWHVVSAASDLVTLHDAGDGTVTARIETAGLLWRTTTVSGGEPSEDTSQVQGGEEYPGLGYTLGRDDAAIRERFWLDTGDGGIGITETSFRAGTPTTVPDEPVETEQLGVWPTLGDEIDDETLSDPRDTAIAYVLAVLEDTIEVGDGSSNRFSAFRQADATSGEIEVSGDITATIVLRSVDGRWHVETVWSPLVEVFELAPGEVNLVAKEDGVLTVQVLDSNGTVVQSMPASGVVAGQERLVVPDAPDGTPLTVRFMLQTPMDAEPGEYANTALGDVRLYGGAMSEREAPQAIGNLGGPDPRAVAEQFIESLIDGEITIGEVSDHEDAAVQVPWDAGVVILDRDGDTYYVVEAIGDSVQIVSATADGTAVRGELRLAQAGTAHISAGGEETSVRNDVDAEGTIVPFELATTATEPALIVVFETDTGFSSVAARVVTT